MSLLRLVRFPNLIIVAFTQYLLNYFLILPALTKADLTPTLDSFHFFLLVFSTVLIAAGGYIINDIVDYEIDIINKPDKIFINKSISEKTAWYLYGAISFLGLMISIYLAYHVDNLSLVIIYPIAVGMLHMYSISWKKKVLIGNVVVSIFCAFVPGIIIFAERTGLMQLQQEHDFILQSTLGTLMAYMLFAFFSTMYREVIKDIEDKDGDAAKFCQTLPIVYGEKKAKGTATFFGVLLLLGLLYWLQMQWKTGTNGNLIFLSALLIAPLFTSLVMLQKANVKAHYKILSKTTKFIMLSGLLYLFLL